MPRSGMCSNDNYNKRRWAGQLSVQFPQPQLHNLHCNLQQPCEAELASHELPLPDHWDIPKKSANHPLLSGISRFLFRALCIVSVARPSLEHHWGSKKSEEGWVEHKTRIVSAITNGNVVAGLTLATSSVFLTTTPPLTSLVGYTVVASYILLLGSFAHSLGSLLIGIAVVTIYDSCDRIWAKDVRIFRYTSLIL
ncbi:hypothetical protein BV22DRAFT_1037342 [Leucogyrophana mollusca]|uniref:Uncharacterized protein n=1 Tax=Leucogyrophana mollusca TaxID=85980 RepID=A0ACB8BAR5_9AGAM|nr:hypothetical protein BV22DRAFT_1037342 [Leucogyrophana mollusca]